MFCPACGVKNELGSLRCFVCKQTLRPLDSPEKPGGRTRTIRVVSSVESIGSIGDRFLALVFDRILLAAILSAVAASLQTTGKSLEDQIAGNRGIAAGAAVALGLIIFLYHIVLEGAFGATLGKAIFGLNVRNDSDHNRFLAAVIRNAIRPLDAVGFYAVAFFVALFSPRKQRIGDWVAKTVVLEYRIHPGARAMFLLVWMALVGVSVWLAWTFCATCFTSSYGFL